jgi:hypothetical protein
VARRRAALPAGFLPNTPRILAGRDTIAWTLNGSCGTADLTCVARAGGDCALNIEHPPFTSAPFVRDGIQRATPPVMRDVDTTV